MSAALMAIVQAVAAQEPKVKAGQPDERGGKMAPAKETDAVKAYASMLQELVQVSTQIAHIDKLIVDAKRDAPAEGSEAHHWHTISIQAMHWSRQGLAERQEGVLARLRALAEAGNGAEKQAPTLAAAALTDAPTAQKVEEEDLQDNAAAAAKEPTAVQSGGSLRVDLEILRTHDPRCCLIVRRIKKLGLESSERLRDHFGGYGEVAQVLVAHSFERPSAHRKNGRVRPAALGFIIMGTPEATAAVLEAGETHDIFGTAVNVSRFEPFADDADLDHQGKGEGEAGAPGAA